MKATRYILFVAVALALAACSKEAEEQKDFSFSLNVRNDDCSEEIVLKGVGDAKIEDVTNLPAWVPGVMLKEEGFHGDPVAIVGVKSDPDLEENRTARISVTMSNGASVTIELTQWPIIKGGTNEVYTSKNAAFEADWSKADFITLVTSFEYVNGKPSETTQRVPLPWDWDHSPICYLPKGEGSDATMEVYKMIDNKADWSLVFNLTGIQNLPGRHYFGLYNRYTGILRIFYYLTNDLIPTNNASDHLWSFSLNSVLAEHLATQFAIPRQEQAVDAFRARAAMPYLTSPNTDVYNPLSGQTSSVLAEGWWAFDVNMSAYRKHIFFDERPLSAASIQLCTYNEQNVILNSVIQGNLGGSLSGSVNLDLLRPSSVSWGWTLASQIVGTLGSTMTNTYWLNEVCNGKRQPRQNIDVRENNAEHNAGEGNENLAPNQVRETKSIIGACASILVGSAISICAKWIESWGSEKVKDEKFGELNASMNLDMNAVMATSGTIGSSTPNKVPPVTMSMDYLKKENPDKSRTGLGDGVWNLEYHPVVYVVKDAYWYENKFTVLSTQKEYQVGESGKYVSDVYSYYLGATRGSRPGLRLITFFDPTSIGGVAFNPELFDDNFETLKVYLSYGIYPGSTPGYTDAFRRDLGLDYQHSWNLDIRKNNKGEYIIDSLKMVRRVHTDEIFKWAGTPEGTEGAIGVRLSSQQLRADHAKLERRYCGQSVFYSNPYATEFIVDQVQYVYDPQVFLPFEDVTNRLYDPQVPDFVVTATVNAYGKDKKDGGQSSLLTNTMRFLPKIELISYKDVPKVYNKILANKETMTGPENTIFVETEVQVQHIGAIVEALKDLDKKK